ncbi:hypothetical protein [Clostridium sp. D33t1_170424_F3]|uniref:hypothetical protein n=1 Tax=Clostridium sp. D33t1_170424_F3 TaxID=2787099 RepID=UPI0018ABBE33|nr:hypothetical protein [Clostridium sp. D33t1_170424_F3]
MSLYNPAADPAVINGIQEAYGLKIGDVVEYTNPDGAVFGPHVVVGFVQNPDPDFLPDNTVYIDSDSPWYPVKPENLKKIGDFSGGDHYGGAAEKQRNAPKYPKRGKNCEYTEDCMWGSDGWCDRPRGNNCEMQEEEPESAT